MDNDKFDRLIKLASQPVRSWARTKRQGILTKKIFAAFILLLMGISPTAVHAEETVVGMFTSHQPPPVNSTVNLFGSVVVQKIKGGYLIGLNPQWYGTSPVYSDDVIFLRSTRQFVDGDIVSGIAWYRGKTFQYINPLGVKKTVRELSEVTDR